jgi:hypothetical protein
MTIINTQPASTQTESIDSRLVRSLDGMVNRMVLVTGRTVHMSLNLLNILRFFLAKRKAGGIIFTVGRPYTFIKRLLKKHKISDERLVYLDSVTALSNERIVNNKSVVFLDGPFSPSMTKQAIDEILSRNSSWKLEFLIIDDISSLTHYSNWQSIKAFLVSLQLEKGSPGITSLIMLDKTASPNLYELCSTICPIEIEIDRTWLQQIDNGI